MNTFERILAGMQTPNAYAKVVGRASYRSAPALRRFASAAAEQACREFVCDLSECPAMDSTFTGVLAGIGLELKQHPEGKLVLAGLSTKLETGLRTLGLDRIAALKVAPVDDRSCGVPAGKISPLDVGNSNEGFASQTVVRAHETLSDLSDENRARFSGVISCFREDPRRPQDGGPGKD